MIELRMLGSIEVRLDTGQSEVATSQPKRAALLAYLAAARPIGFHRRDTLLALLWPELDAARARGALSQALHGLRNTLGDDAIASRGNAEIGLDRSKVWCDVTALTAALDAGESRDALGLYRGPLLHGFHVSGALEFERWLESERTYLRERVSEAGWSLTELERDPVEAARMARRAAAFSPYDEGVLRRLITFLDQRGDRPEAIRAYKAFVARLREDLDVEPSEATKALIERIAASHGERPAVLHTRAPRDASAPDAVEEAANERLGLRSPTAQRAIRRGLVALAAVALVGAAAVGVRFARSAPYVVENPRQSFVILPFRVTADDSAMSWWSEGAANMLAIDLEMWREIRVVDRRRVTALAELLEVSQLESASLTEALAVARAARVGTLIVGDVTGHAGNVEIVVRLYDVGSEDPLQPAARIGGSAQDDLRPLFDQVAADILDLSGAPGIELDLRAATTTSLGAYRQYLHGLDALFSWQLDDAIGRFRAAAELDSTFALAYQRLALAMAWQDEPDQDKVRELTEQAVRHSERLPWRERQHILAFSASNHGDSELASELYRELIAADSTDAEAWYSLADVEFHEEESAVRDSGGGLVPTWDIGITLAGFERSVELDPRFHIAYGHLFNMLEYVNRRGFHPVPVPKETARTDDSLIADGRAYFYPAWRDSAFWIQLDPADPDALVRRYASDSIVGVLRDRAIRYARRWSNAAPDESRPHFELRNLHIEGRSWGSARAAQEAYLAIEADTGYHQKVILGVLHLGSGAVDTAEALIEMALEQDPQPWPGNPAASLFVATGRPSRALDVADVVPVESWIPAGGHNVQYGFSKPLLARIRMLGSTGANRPELGNAVDSLRSTWSARYGKEDLSLLHCLTTVDVGPALLLLGHAAVRSWVETFVDPLPERCRNFTIIEAWRSYLLLEADSLDAANRSFDLAIAQMEQRFPPPLPFDFYFLAGLAQDLDRHSQAVRVYARLDSSAVWVLYTNDSPRVGYDWGLLSLSYLRRARSYEALQQHEQAVRYYRRFLTVWTDAEPDLQRYADEARRALDRLGAR